MTFKIYRLSPDSYEFRRKGKHLVVTITASSLEEAVRQFHLTHYFDSKVDFVLGG